MKTNYLPRFTETAARLLGGLLNFTSYTKEYLQIPKPAEDNKSLTGDSIVNMYKGAIDLERCEDGFRTPYEVIFSVGVDYVSGPDNDTLRLISYESYTVMGAKIAAKGDGGFGTALSFIAPRGAHYHFNLIYGKSSVWFGDNMELRKPYIIKMPGTSTYFQVYFF